MTTGHSKPFAAWTVDRGRRARRRAGRDTGGAAVSGRRAALAPILPFTGQKLHGYLGNEGPVQAGGWRLVMPSAGRPLAETEPLFKKLDPDIVEEEEAKLGV